MLPPGDYSGIARFDLAGVETVKIPWRVKVLAIEFNAEPARLELGDTFPGSTIKSKLRIHTNGGVIALKSAASPLLKNVPFEPFTLDKSGREIDIQFNIAIPDARRIETRIGLHR